MKNNESKLFGELIEKWEKLVSKTVELNDAEFLKIVKEVESVNETLKELNKATK